MDLDDLLVARGRHRGQLEAFVDDYVAGQGGRPRVEHGHHPAPRRASTACKAIVNVALARGNVGRDGAGLMPIRGHSGVQGGAEMGAYATALPRGPRRSTPTHAAALGAQWGFAVPDHAGLTAAEQVEAAERGELDVLCVDGGNFLDVLPDPAAGGGGPGTGAAAGAPGHRAHRARCWSPGDDVILLPAATRYEQEGGGTETTTERRVAFSPEIPRQVGEARSEWRIFAELAPAGPARPRRSASRGRPTATCGPRSPTVVPAYAGIEDLADDRRRHPVGRPPPVRRRRLPDAESGRPASASPTAGRRRCPRAPSSCRTRRGKQFNSMVFGATDPLTGAGRDAVFIDEDDAAELGLGDGDGLTLALDGRHVRRAGPAWCACRRRTLQVHWPEGNVLVPSGPSTASRARTYPTTTPSSGSNPCRPDLAVSPDRP